jgi:hypothetical protein
MKPRVLVAGAAGLIGSALSRALLEAGYEIVELDVRARAPGARGDVRDADTLGRALEGCVGVVHLAAVSCPARIWRATLPRQARLAPGVDFAELARTFELSGGHIRNAALRAAFFAASSGELFRALQSALLTTLTLVVGVPWWWTRLGRRALTVTDDALERLTAAIRESAALRPPSFSRARCAMRRFGSLRSSSH